MGWKDLFKPIRKPSKAQPDPRIRWFGKLPTYGDYYTSPAEEDWSVEFNDWVLRGFEIHQNRAAEAGLARRRLPVSGCVVRLPKSGMTALASVQDYGGDMQGRPFPLCFYVGVPTSDSPGPTSDLSLQACRVLGELADLQQDVVRLLNAPGRFESVFAGRTVGLGKGAPPFQGGERSSWAEQARSVSLADWFAGAEPVLKVKDPAAWFRLAAEWGDRIASLESESFEPTLRLPLAAGVPTEVQVAGWLRWLESRMGLGRRALSLVVSAELDGSPGHLSVIAREPVPEDFLLATRLWGTLAYVDDLSRAESSAGDEPASEPNDRSAALAGTWSDFAESPVGAS